MNKPKTKTKSGAKARAKHYEPKLKLHCSFEKAVKILVSEPKMSK